MSSSSSSSISNPLLVELTLAYEQERDEILASLPQEYKAMFGQIGFTKWGRALAPILILNPYNVPGECNRWMAMYEMLREQNELNSMSYLVYFYGAPRVRRYGFVQPKRFIPYDQEKSKGSDSVHKLPKEIWQKIESRASLSNKEQSMQRAYEEMEEDLLKSPEDRVHEVVDFIEEEEYEYEIACE